MRKIIFYFVFVVVLVFTMPIIFTNQFETKEVSSSKIEKFDYGDYNKIKLQHVDNGNIEELELDNYLYGVIASEMPASFEIEALKAQAVVARTYTIYHMKNGNKHENADVCDSALCCQAWISKDNRFARWEEDKRSEYWNKIEKAVNDTKGKVILYKGEPINAFFHSNSGGKTELSINVWGGDFPYLQTVETNGEDAYTSYKSEVTVSKDELIQKLFEKYSDFKIDFSKDEIKILEYTESGRVQKIKIGNKELTGTDVRNIFGLKSTNFDINIDGDFIKFFVIGYGHGVGLSQCGSDVLAKNGKNYIEIIKHYYKDVEVSE